MLSGRFSELAQKPDAPFIFAGGGRGSFLARTKESATLVALVKEDGIERGLDALLGEAERVSRFGFTATELDRQKQSVLVSYQRLAIEKDNTLDANLAGEYIRNFLINEPLPSAEDEYALHQRFLPGSRLTRSTNLRRNGIPGEPSGRGQRSGEKRSGDPG